MDTLLRAERLTKVYGADAVVDELTFHVDEGEALGVVGPNGAGKTTTLGLIAGSVTVDGGRVTFAGRDVTRIPARSRTHLGMARTFQIPRPFAGMTVFENVLVAGTYGARETGDTEERVASALERTGLDDVANTVAGSLPLLRRKRLELARALATGPRLLLLDEIAGGLTEAEVRELIATIKSLHGEGTTIVWIEHVVHALLSVVDRILAIDFGRMLVEGDPHEVMASSEVQRVYLGLEE
ncbi:MAG: ABC transporter ATP-binding protein [Actinobacteria bacterium]|nr:ABC transporter ATP-binding protein [Actinomycetota bacterium]